MFAIAVGATTLARTWLASAADATTPDKPPVSTEEGRSSSAEVAAGVAEHERLLANLAAAPRAPNNVPSEREARGNDPPTAGAQTDFDLATYFARRLGSLRLAHLERHSDLNATHRPLPAARVEDLRKLLDLLNERSGDVAKNWRLTRTHEMVRCVERGLVSPLPTKAPSDSDLRFLAQALLQHEDVRAAGHTQESLEADLRKNPPPNSGVGDNHLVHGGRTYLMRDFVTLPESDAMIDALRYLAVDSLLSVVAWFAANDLGPNEERVQASIHRLSSLSAREFRSLN